MINSLETLLNEYFKDRIIKPKLEKFSDNDKVILNLFPESEEKKSKWEIDISVKLLAAAMASNDDKNIDINVFIEEVAKKAMHNFGIKTKEDELVFWDKRIIINGETKKINFPEYLLDNDIIFIEGESKSGKTVIAKQICNQEIYSTKKFWLDFNGGVANFSEMLVDLLTTTEDESIIIVLDNLECCGVNLATKIYSFFASLVKAIVRADHSEGINLIVIQNKNAKVSNDALDHNTLRWSKDKTMKEVKDISIKAQSDNDMLLITNANGIKNKINFKIRTAEEKRILFKIALISSYGAEVSIKKEECAKVREIIKDIREGIKLFNNKKVTFYDARTSCLLMTHIKNNYCELGFDVAFNGKDFDIVSKDIIDEYIRDVNLSLNDAAAILANNAYLYSNEDEKNNAIRDYVELIQMARTSVEKMIEKVESADGICKQFFGNHLGAILFAAEALSSYANDDWRALNSWRKLADYVRDVYYIEGQRLPEIRVGKESMEKTFNDFYAGENVNSIRNQIILHNEILDRNNTPLDINQVLEDDLIDDKILSYWLSPYQFKNSNVDDINRFFNTYILALLFEFEVTAPTSEYDNERVEKLFKKIELNIINEENENSAYFYPARIPWVSARMLLALNLYPKNRNSGIRNIISRYKVKLCNWLKKCSSTFTIKDKTYRFWAPGTGTWNGVLETTMMCTFALKNNTVNDLHYVEEGLNFINHQESNWYTPQTIADGIWACETIWQSQNLNNKTFILEQVSRLKKQLDTLFGGNLELTNSEVKDDKSLGDSHIAKTLISLVLDLLQRKVNFENIFADHRNIIDMSSKTKVFISFLTSTGQHAAEKIYDHIKSNNNYLPYIYTKDMKAGNWPKQLKNAIVQSDYYILIISKDVFKSINVLNEVKEMLNSNAPILPVLVDSIDYIEELEKIDKNVFGLSYYNKLLDILNSEQTNRVNFDSNKPEYAIQSIMHYCRKE